MTLHTMNRAVLSLRSKVMFAYFIYPPNKQQQKRFFEDIITNYPLNINATDIIRCT